MNRFRIPSQRLAALVLAVALSPPGLSAAEDPPIVSYRDGRLVYTEDARGNRVPDFSHAGYAGGNRSVPDVPVRVVVEPRPGDSTARIQRALDYVSALPADSEGIRGAVLLLKGRHEVDGSLAITTPGVVLRGQGTDEDGTRVVATGQDRRTLIRVVGQNNRTVQTNADWRVVDAYVPVGATRFNVGNATALNPGSTIRVIRPCTQEWVEELGMYHFGGEEGGFRWKPGSRDLAWDRRVTGIHGNEVTIDAPLTTALDPQFGGGFVELYAWPGRIRQVGIENLELISEYDSKNRRDEAHSWMAITMENVEDAWVRQVTFRHFAGSAVAIYESGKQITVQDCLSFDPISEPGGARRNTYFTMGQLTLFLRCYAESGRHDFSVGYCAAGPNAFVQCDAKLPLADSGPIDSWASGVLYDNVRIDGNALNLMQRGRQGQGSGWAAANSVLWQCNAALARCYNPPTAQNWAFGTWAEFEGDGIWRSSNDFVSPDSLYAGQLGERLGSEAAGRLQLMPRPHEESSNPTVERAQELAAEGHKPAPLLADYIAAAAQRDPIPCSPEEAIQVDSLPPSDSAPRIPRSALALTNGWLTVGGRLLVGGTTGVQWWRGSIRPEEATQFGFGVTRFVPGRVGQGYTDNLDEVGEAMQARRLAALDHNYGLWYDRRRDDHERVRRMNGDVLPPFYEQPFARSGQGTAWDGLSQYDLTRYNSWYWSRLREFADVCEQRGLVLFHQNYFQHNILEAGAHWADCPWRTANNINHTDFPEPPNYAGDKRIFMAELFYDVQQPVRRELHRQYIRQCLDNFATNSNVIQFTSAEYTGPLHFVQFWLDTISEWQRDHSTFHASRSASSSPLIALSATKDVQDAILSDPQRSEVVDVIDFRYWWRTGKGEFAPPGGHNLAPRQFERRWRGGRPDDMDLARMTAEYRPRFPDKAIIADFNNRGWAFLCAGGSIPNLPRGTDEGLLRGIPRMQPWNEATNSRCWILREPGQQYLVYLGGPGPAQVDLGAESGLFAVYSILPRTGAASLFDESIAAGGTVDLEPFVKAETTVLWLVKR